ncbi:MAG: hypothetical protein BYD32DRAFT_420373 [Podila humilis]|nr:MAG: hypothetical protein BYD32DRAFT_420373 [Podila humilis]
MNTRKKHPAQKTITRFTALAAGCLIFSQLAAMSVDAAPVQALELSSSSSHTPVLQKRYTCFYGLCNSQQGK